MPTSTKEVINPYLILLAEELRKTGDFDPEFLLGIEKGQVKESRYEKVIHMPFGEIKKTGSYEFEWLILIDLNSYLHRKNYRHFTEKHDNDIADVSDIVKSKFSNSEKIIGTVDVKPNINDKTFLGALGEVLRYRQNQAVKLDSEFLDGFSQGKWERSISKKEKSVPYSSLQPEKVLQTDMKFNLKITIPFDNYKYINISSSEDELNYIKKKIREIKHFEHSIDILEIKPDLGDYSLLTALDEVVELRSRGSKDFNRQFISGFSGGTWEIVESERFSNPTPLTLLDKAPKLEKINRLIIHIPTENFKQEIDYKSKIDMEYVSFIHGIVGELLPNETVIDEMEFKPM